MKQRRGYPDQWPYAVNIYMDDSGRCKGDATLKYEDPNAASAAPNFFDGSELTGRPGVKLGVTLAGPRTLAGHRTLAVGRSLAGVDVGRVRRLVALLAR